MQNETLIDSLPLLSGLTREDAAAVKDAVLSVVKEYSSGEVILAEECFSPSLLFVLVGRASVTVRREGKATLLNTLRTGDLFGAASLFGANGCYPTTVTAKGTTRCAVIGEETLVELIRRYPQVGINYIRFLSEKIRFLNERIDTLSGRNVESKLAKFLLQADGKGALHSHCNMSQLASALDVGRASLYRLLRKMEQNGLITFEGGIIQIVNKIEIERISKQ